MRVVLGRLCLSLESPCFVLGLVECLGVAVFVVDAVDGVWGPSVYPFVSVALVPAYFGVGFAVGVWVFVGVCELYVVVCGVWAAGDVAVGVVHFSGQMMWVVVGLGLRKWCVVVMFSEMAIMVWVFSYAAIRWRSSWPTSPRLWFSVVGVLLCLSTIFMYVLSVSMYQCSVSVLNSISIWVLYHISFCVGCVLWVKMCRSTWKNTAAPIVLAMIVWVSAPPGSRVMQTASMGVDSCHRSAYFANLYNILGV